MVQCRFFNTKHGCKFGSECQFEHVKWTKCETEGCDLVCERALCGKCWAQKKQAERDAFLATLKPCMTEDCDNLCKNDWCRECWDKYRDEERHAASAATAPRNAATAPRNNKKKNTNGSAKKRKNGNKWMRDANATSGCLNCYKSCIARFCSAQCSLQWTNAAQ